MILMCGVIGLVYFAWSCLLQILTHDSPLHTCAKFDLCAFAYLRDITQLSVIFD